MGHGRQTFGKKSEALAAAHLVKNGYQILELNYRTRFGEIDIIARDGESLVFVEVKARKSPFYGNPKWALTPKKKRHISMTALYYLKATDQSKAKARFDVVAIWASPAQPGIEIVKNAFELAYT